MSTYTNMRVWSPLLTVLFAAVLAAPASAQVTGSVVAWGTAKVFTGTLDDAAKYDKNGWRFADPNDPTIGPNLLNAGQCCWTSWCNGFCARPDATYFLKENIGCGAGFQCLVMKCFAQAGCSTDPAAPAVAPASNPPDLLAYPAGGHKILPVDLDGAGVAGKRGWGFVEPGDKLVPANLLAADQCCWTTYCNGFCAKPDKTYFLKGGSLCGAGYKCSAMVCLKKEGCPVDDASSAFGTVKVFPGNLDTAGKLDKLGWRFTDVKDPDVPAKALAANQCCWSSFCNGFCAKPDLSYFLKENVGCGAGFTCNVLKCMAQAGCANDPNTPTPAKTVANPPGLAFYPAGAHQVAPVDLNGFPEWQKLGWQFADPRDKLVPANLLTADQCCWTGFCNGFCAKPDKSYFLKENVGCGAPFKCSVAVCQKVGGCAVPAAAPVAPANTATAPPAPPTKAAKCPDWVSLAKKYAPVLKFASTEKYLPSDTASFLTHMNNGTDRLTTKENMPEPSTRLSWFYGSDPTKTPVPIYCVVVPRSEVLVDFVYMAFYPYNYGKTISVGGILGRRRLLFGWGDFVNVFKPVAVPFVKAFEEVKNIGEQGVKAVEEGAKKSYDFVKDALDNLGTDCANHVGDWETGTVRVQLNADGTNSFVQAGGSRHGAGFTWTRADLDMADANRPTFYPAMGGHGLYNRRGRSPNDDSTLALLGSVGGGLDEHHEGDGIVWDTSKNVNVKVIGRPCADVGDWSWWFYRGDWGNDKRGCGTGDGCAGQCRLNAGPDSPIKHGEGCGLWTPDNNAWCPAF